MQVRKLLHPVKLTKEIESEEPNINDIVPGNEDGDEGINDESKSKRKKRSDKETKEDEYNSHETGGDGKRSKQNEKEEQEAPTEEFTIYKIADQKIN